MTSLLRRGKGGKLKMQDDSTSSNVFSVETETQRHLTGKTNMQNGNSMSRFNSEYEKIKELGKGGFGVVFEAKNRVDQKHYAIKRIPIKGEEEKEKALREAQGWARLDHPHIVRYHDAWIEEPPLDWQDDDDSQEGSAGSTSTNQGSVLYSSTGEPRERGNVLGTLEDSSGSSFGEISPERQESLSNAKNTCMSVSSDGVEFANDEEASGKENVSENQEAKKKRYLLFIKMELCDEVSLADKLEAGTLDSDLDHKLKMFKDIVEAVIYLHEKQLMHRDLKPSNILFSTEGKVKVGDFGLIKPLAGLDDDTKTSSTLQNLHTNNVGTHLYMAPELGVKGHYGAEIDTYSLGIILVELLIPFSTEMERRETLLNVKDKGLQSSIHVSVFNKTQKASKLANRMTSKLPSARPPLDDVLMFYLPAIIDSKKTKDVSNELNNETPKLKRNLICLLLLPTCLAGLIFTAYIYFSLFNVFEPISYHIITTDNIEKLGFLRTNATDRDETMQKNYETMQKNMVNQLQMQLQLMNNMKDWCPRCPRKEKTSKTKTRIKTVGATESLSTRRLGWERDKKEDKKKK